MHGATYSPGFSGRIGLVTAGPSSILGKYDDVFDPLLATAGVVTTAWAFRIFSFVSLVSPAHPPWFFGL